MDTQTRKKIVKQPKVSRVGGKKWCSVLMTTKTRDFEAYAPRRRDTVLEANDVREQLARLTDFT